MILSLAALHVRYQHDKCKDLLYPWPSRMWWFYTGLPPSPRQPNTWLHGGSPLPLPRDGPEGGGRTCKPGNVGWPREQKILAFTWQGWGGSTRCTKASSSSILSADLKSETRKVKVVYNAYLVSISCCDFDIFLVSSLTIFGSAGEKALQGHSIF
jgi:hypothetical protein